LSEWLAAEGCTRIATEATGIWEADGQVLSDSAIAAVSDQRAHIKNVPGRNTDVNDVTWLAPHLMAHGLTRRGLRDRP
jgi:transposase